MEIFKDIEETKQKGISLLFIRCRQESKNVLNFREPEPFTRFVIDKLKKVRRLCENCYQFKEMTQADREKLMEVSMYELVLVS